MKIVFFTPGLEIGGIERVFINYSTLFANNPELDVYYLTCYNNGTFLTLIDDRVKIVNIGTNDLKRSLWGIVRFLRSIKPDYIITANTATLVIILAKIFSLSKVKIIASHHNYINNEVTSILDKRIIFKAYNFVSKVIAVSKGIAQHLADKGVRPSKIATIYNPIDTESIDELKSKNLPDNILCFKPYILFVGRLSKVKNIDLLVESFKILSLDYKNLDLLIIGDGPLREHIESTIEGVSNIHVLGSIASPFNFIAHASLIVLPSFSEAFPTILLEAIYLGKTIVATPTCGANEILDNGKFGYISKSFNSSKEFANLILYALNHQINPDRLKAYFLETFGTNQIINLFQKECLI